VNLRAALNAAMIVAVGASWGLLAPASKAMFAADPAAFDGVSLAVARAVWTFPFIVLVLGAAWVRERPRLSARQVAALSAAGVAFGLGITLTFSIASMHTSVAHISFLIGTSPVTNSLAAALVFRTPLGRREQIAVALGIIGVVLLAASRTGGTASLFGDGLMLVWLAAFAVYAVVLRSVGTRQSVVFTMSAVGSVAMAAMILVGVAIPGALRGAAHVTATPATSWWFFAEIVFGSTLYGQTAFAAAVRRVGVAVATIGAEYSALAFGIAASILSREAWSPLTAIAGLVLIAALAVTFAPRASAQRTG
jgi:drug/metabolite transporter (DMT)-like permease